MSKRSLKSKSRLIKNIQDALLRDYPEYWNDALSFALACVQESYPIFNSHSTVDVACPVSGKVRPVEVCSLYKGAGVTCCVEVHASMIIEKARNSRDSECFNTDAHKVSARNNIKKARSYISDDSRRKNAEKARASIEYK